MGNRTWKHSSISVFQNEGRGLDYDWDRQEHYNIYCNIEWNNYEIQEKFIKYTQRVDEMYINNSALYKYLLWIGNNELFLQLCNALGLENIKTDSRFLTNSLRVQNREALISILSKTIENETCNFWLEKFEGYKFPYGPVNSIQQAFDDPQVPQTRAQTIMYMSCG